MFLLRKSVENKIRICQTKSNIFFKNPFQQIAWAHVPFQSLRSTNDLLISLQNKTKAFIYTLYTNIMITLIMRSLCLVYASWASVLYTNLHVKVRLTVFFPRRVYICRYVASKVKNLGEPALLLFFEYVWTKPRITAGLRINLRSFALINVLKNESAIRQNI